MGGLAVRHERTATSSGEPEDTTNTRSAQVADTEG